MMKPDFRIDTDGILRFRNRVVVPAEIKEKVLSETHQTKYSIHPGGTKMYKDLKRKFWWEGMKKDVVSYIQKCLSCQLVKAEHQRPSGKLQPLPIPSWKWEQVIMDFVTGLPVVRGGYDSIWVVVDRCDTP